MVSIISLRWRHNDHDGVSNHQPHGCLLNRSFRRRSKKTLKLCVTSLCMGNSPGPVNSPHKGPVTWKILSFDDVIMCKMHNVNTYITFIKILKEVHGKKKDSLSKCQVRKIITMCTRNKWCIWKITAILNWKEFFRRLFSSRRYFDRLFNRMFRLTSWKVLTLCVTGPLWGEPPVTGGSPSQRANYAENVYVPWCLMLLLSMTIYFLCVYFVEVWVTPLSFG